MLSAAPSPFFVQHIVSSPILPWEVSAHPIPHLNTSHLSQSPGVGSHPTFVTCLSFSAFLKSPTCSADVIVGYSLCLFPPFSYKLKTEGFLFHIKSISHDQPLSLPFHASHLPQKRSCPCCTAIPSCMDKDCGSAVFRCGHQALAHTPSNSAFCSVVAWV